MRESYDDLVAGALDGDRRAIAKVLSLVEQGGDGARFALAQLHPRTGNAWSIGITGAPGAGKSTLTDSLVVQLRKGGEGVGVLAVDPSSPFSGGAILGDRVRMQQHSTDDGVFIRSMASRGHLGGLAVATPQAVRVLDAVGKHWVVIETVGVGQVEVEIASHADTTIVVVNPGWGDAVQAAKAGLLEIADIFVVNKADRPGAADAVRDLEGMLELGGQRAWRPPVLRTVATTGEGVDELFDAIVQHRAQLEASGEAVTRRRSRLRDELRGLVAARIEQQVDALCSGKQFDALVDQVMDRATDPYTAADALVQ
ncbi:MAG TPA: methylmalonyl Co-A mutase-associated GTPase MeaB [Acidimicrobiia bacterium]|jgi:LAO/AO transport system kinase|nr:methylmalonyl Co-A mutase-associated GTPase MeaB [Acidimicrobiia bacterium]